MNYLDDWSKEDVKKKTLKVFVISTRSAND